MAKCEEHHIMEDKFSTRSHQRFRTSRRSSELGLRDRRRQKLPRSDPLNLKIWTKFRNVGHEGCLSSLANHAKRSEETCIYMGRESRKDVPQDAEWSTIGLDNLRLLQDARSQRQNVQIAGLDTSSSERGQSVTVQPRMGRNASRNGRNPSRRRPRRTLHDSNPEKLRVQRHLGLVHL